jgi:hypothetical protein
MIHSPTFPHSHSSILASLDAFLSAQDFPRLGFQIQHTRHVCGIGGGAHTEVEHMQEGHTEVLRKKFDFHPQQVEGHTDVPRKKLEFWLGKLEVDHMKAASMNTDDRKRLW